MAVVNDIYRYLDTQAPFQTQMDFDNSGFLVGHGEAEVKRVLVALDITEEVIDEAIEMSCQLIVSHHPVIFHPVRSITDGDPVGRRLLALTENHLAAICAHTNLDLAANGVNDALAKKLGLKEVGPLQQAGWNEAGEAFGIGRIGFAEGHSDLRSFASFVRDTLDAQGLRFEDAGRSVHKVAVGGGSCGNMLNRAAAEGCDTFLTADVKYDVFLDARAMGINLIDAGHFSTENVICPVVARWLAEGFPQLEIFCAQKHKEVFSCL